MYERDEDEANNHEEKPGGNFFEANWMPAMHLMWIEPNIHVSSDIFSDPDDTRYEEKSNNQIHRIIFFIRSKKYRRPPIGEENPEYNEPSEIRNEVMTKEI
jgi:hypothetical protein